MRIFVNLTNCKKSYSFPQAVSDEINQCQLKQSSTPLLSGGRVLFFVSEHLRLFYFWLCYFMFICMLRNIVEINDYYYYNNISTTESIMRIVCLYIYIYKHNATLHIDVSCTRANFGYNLHKFKHIVRHNKTKQELISSSQTTGLSISWVSNLLNILPVHLYRFGNWLACPFDLPKLPLN